MECWPDGSQALALSQLLYSKFTEYLEDFHVWASVHSRPSGRGPLHTPRLTVAFTLLCAHACAAALVTAAGHEQVGAFLSHSSVPALLCEPFQMQGLGNWCSEGGYSGEGPHVLQPGGDMGHAMASADCHHRAWLSQGLSSLESQRRMCLTF